MSSPRDPGRDLRLERLDERDGLRSAHLGDIARVASHETGARSRSQFQAAYEALIDSVFTAPGAAEWLFSLKVAMVAMFASKDREMAPREPIASDAIRKAEPGSGRI